MYVIYIRKLRFLVVVWVSKTLTSWRGEGTGVTKCIIKLVKAF